MTSFSQHRKNLGEVGGVGEKRVGNRCWSISKNWRRWQPATHSTKKHGMGGGNPVVQKRAAWQEHTTNGGGDEEGWYILRAKDREEKKGMPARVGWIADNEVEMRRTVLKTSKEKEKTPINR